MDFDIRLSFPTANLISQARHLKLKIPKTSLFLIKKRKGTKIIRFIQSAAIGGLHVKSEEGLDLGCYNATNIKHSDTLWPKSYWRFANALSIHEIFLFFRAPLSHCLIRKQNRWWGRGREIAEQLRAFTALAKAVELAPSIHNEWLTATDNSSSRGLNTLLASMGTIYMWHT